MEMNTKQYRKKLYQLVTLPWIDNKINHKNAYKALQQSIPMLEKYLKKIQRKHTFKARQLSNCIQPQIKDLFLESNYFPFSPHFIELLERLNKHNYIMACDSMTALIYYNWISHPNICYCIIKTLKKFIDQTADNKKYHFENVDSVVDSVIVEKIKP